MSNTHPARSNENIRWKRATIDVLAAIGAITLSFKGTEIEHWLRAQLHPTPAAITKPGLTQENITAITDQLRTALHNGGTESFVSEAMQCMYGTQMVTLENPIVMILPNGVKVMAGLIPGPQEGPYDVLLIDPLHPGAPLDNDNPACVYLPDPSQPELQFQKTYDFYFENGDPMRPVDATSGDPLQDIAGSPLNIGKITIP